MCHSWNHHRLEIIVRDPHRPARKHPSRWPTGLNTQKIWVVALGNVENYHSVIGVAVVEVAGFRTRVHIVFIEGIQSNDINQVQRSKWWIEKLSHFCSLKPGIIDVRTT